MPIVNTASSIVCLLSTVRELSKRYPEAPVLIYNFNFSLLMAALYLRLFHRGVLVHNVEDVSVPKLGDWLPGARARPLQQLVFWLCMNGISRLTNAYIVPTERFLQYLPFKRDVAIVTGCIAVRPLPMPLSQVIKVLYAGKIELEHGIVEFIAALHKLDAHHLSSRIQVNICGPNSDSQWVLNSSASLSNITVNCLGFLADADYRELLASSQICVALQDPEGRYAYYKTPSKFYEFLGFGKAVIATDVGDIRSLPNDIFIMLPHLSPHCIYSALLHLIENADELSRLGSSAYEYSQRHFTYDSVGASIRDQVLDRLTSCHNT